MQFTIASLQAFIITGVMLQLAAGTPIGLGMNKAGTDSKDRNAQLLWLSATKPAKRATVMEGASSFPPAEPAGIVEDSLLYAKSGKGHPLEDVEARA